MRLIKSFFIAFSVYSRLPMPQFEWKEEDMKYMLCFFPWVGAVVGGCVWLWHYICNKIGIGELCYTLIGAALPLVLTGGFHADGFMDTADALHSYQPREKKLEILKDSHIGAFAVIMLAAYGLIYLGVFAEVADERLLRIVCAGFFLSRCLSGIGVVAFPAARKDGMLVRFAGTSHKNIVKWSLYLQSTCCICFMLAQSVLAGAVVTAVAFAVFGYYYFRTKKEFGGVTGDTAGWFLLICEEGMLAAAAVAGVLAG